MLSENLSPRKGARGVKRVASASQMADFPGMAPTGPDLAVPARPRSLPVKMMAALVLCIVFFISATGHVGWHAANPGSAISPASGTEKSERKLMGSLPQGLGVRECRGPTAKEEPELPTLVSMRRWRTGKERPRQAVSLVTHLSVDRLPSLENQCITWPDHLVAVVYVPMVANSTGGPPLLPLYRHTSLDDVVAGVDSFHNYMETTAACAFHVELVGQFVAPGIFPGPYPINALRNRAMALSPTDLAIPVDADFVVTPLLGLPGAGYRDAAVFAQMEELAAGRQALLLPALELTNRWQDLALARNVARDVVMAGKSMARGALQGGVVAPYAPPDGPARDVANASRWAASEAAAAYEVPLDPRAEPAVLVSLATVPWFDERFVDSSGAAAPWFAHLRASGFSFLVHPFAFVVHVPHTRPRPSSQYMEAQVRLRGARMGAMATHVVEELKDGSYRPVLRECAGAEGNSSEVTVATATLGASVAPEVVGDAAALEAAQQAAAEAQQRQEEESEYVAGAAEEDKQQREQQRGEEEPQEDQEGDGNDEMEAAEDGGEEDSAMEVDVTDDEAADDARLGVELDLNAEDEDDDVV